MMGTLLKFIWSVYMSRSDNNNEPSQQSSGVPTAGSQPVFRPMELGIDYTQASSKPHIENRVRFGFSGYEPTAKGTMQKVVVESVKKRDKSDAQQDGAATAPSTPTP